MGADLDEIAERLTRLTNRSFQVRQWDSLPFTNKKALVTSTGKEFFPYSDLLVYTDSEKLVPPLPSHLHSPQYQAQIAASGIFWHINEQTHLATIFSFDEVHFGSEPAPSQRYNVGEQLPIEAFVGAVVIPGHLMTANNVASLQRLETWIKIRETLCIGRRSWDYEYFDRPYTQEQKERLPELFEHYTEYMAQVDFHPRHLRTFHDYQTSFKSGRE